MKKIAFLLALVLLLCAISPISVLATGSDEVEATSIDSNLIRHYNFYDHATTSDGQRPDNVANSNAYRLYPKNVELKNGLGYVKAASGSYYNESTTKDITGLSDMTVFLAFKPEGSPTGSFSYVMNMTSIFEMFIDQNGLGIRTGVDPKQMLLNSDNNRHSIEMGKYVWVAVCLDWESTTLNSTVYISTDYGKTFTAYSTTIENGTKKPSDFSKLWLGKSNATVAGILDYYFDDLRIYDKALTKAEVESIELDKTPTVAPTNVHGQTRVDTTNEQFGVRFCATIDSLKYNEVGFDIVAVDANGTELDTFKHSCTAVYESVYALGEKVTAEELGGKYLIAYKIEQIPKSVGAVTFKITPYAVTDDDTWYGDTVSATYDYATLANAT